MPRKGENIYKRKDGRWEGRYIKARSKTGKAVYGYVYAPTYKEAKRKRSQAIINIEANQTTICKVPETTMPTCFIRKLANDWMNSIQSQIKKSSYVKYYNILHTYNRYNINGLIIVDKNAVGRKISGIPVVAELENAASYICQQWVDEVFVNIDESYSYPDELIQELLEMGMVVHVNLAKVKSTSGQKQFVETVGGYTVLTTTMNYATDRQAFAKRALDILGGLVGCFLTGIIFIFVAPAIYISSPGPIFFSQTRIGQNGKPFKMYKFRSMYMDAEERKAELMAQNKMSDGRMFKLDFDPRVIGNKILPDGSRKTGIGEFIRKTSLDEFPQFWNVLNGTMSLVGTRPILQDELLKYELHHRARIAIKPGITGMWQVSGRSDITDFEEVVRLDTEYISSGLY